MSFIGVNTETSIGSHSELSGSKITWGKSQVKLALSPFRNKCLFRLRRNEGKIVKRTILGTKFRL